MRITPLGYAVAAVVTITAVLCSVSAVSAALGYARGSELSPLASAVAAGHGQEAQSQRRDTPPKCVQRNKLASTLFEAGFRGTNLREAWAIAMRESGGDPTLGPGHPQYNGFDIGLFQFNRPSYSGESWWSEKDLLDASYNASVAFAVSQGGKTWWPWGLDGSGNTDAGAYRSIWTEAEIDQMITVPFRKFYHAYPCG